MTINVRRLRTANGLIEELDSDFAWRLQEIASLRKAARSASGITKSALLRASVTLLYAHWEGYVKTTAIRYAAFLSMLGITFGEVQRCFSGIKALGYVKSLHQINKRLFAASDLLSSLHRIDGDKFTIPLEDHIADVGNLNYDLFQQIAEFLFIDSRSYSARKPLIDESLLKQRNEIAHGRRLLIDDKDFETLVDETLQTMRQFRPCGRNP